MIDTIWNFPGGVGKTSLTAELALTLDRQVITNDLYTPLSLILSEDSLLRLQPDQKMPILPEDADIFFDLGGYPDARAISALKQSQHVLIPTIAETGRLGITLNAIQEIKRYNQNIIVIANRTDPHDSDLKLVKKAIGKKYPEIPIFPLKESRAFPNILVEKKSIHDMVKEGGVKQYHFKKLVEQLDLIISHITNKQ